MSKQKRPPSRSHAEPKRAEQAPESEVAEQAVIGDQAVQAQIEGVDHHSPTHDIEAVRAEALPMV